jgi:hypothetical protein
MLAVCATPALLSTTAAVGQDGEVPLATAKHDSGLIVEVMEVKVDSNQLLSIRWRYRNPTGKTIQLFAATPLAPFASNAPKNIPLRFFPAVYYVEGQFQTGKALKHYIVFEQGTKKLYAKALGKTAVNLQPNQQFEIWAKFAPPAPGATISLVLPDTSVIENLQVAR